MKHRRYAICIFMLCFFFVNSLPVRANSAATFWRGTSSTGVISGDRDCPIEVESEILRLQIPEFPHSYYETADAFLSYSAYVEATYSLYNPTDYEVTFRLFFPFGTSPSYYISSSREPEEISYAYDTDKFTVTVNGENIEKSIRHSLVHPYDSFDLDTDLPRLHDGFVQDPFYTPDLPVTQYTFAIHDVDTKTYSAATVAWDLPSDQGSTKIYWPDISGLQTRDDGSVRVSGWADSSDSLIIYAIGTPLESLPAWKFYKNGGVDDREEISGSAVLQTSQTMTFQEFALKGWSNETGVSQTDWYNAVVEELREDALETQSSLVFLNRYAQAFSDCLMRWYDYTITIPAGETVTNTVTAPLYPSIQTDYEPPVYEYTYLLSPARTWADFHALQILIETPFALIESSLEGFEKEGTGYRLSLDSLPDTELTLTLSSSEDPSPIHPVSSGYGSYLLTGIFAAVILFALLLFLFIRIRRSRRPGKKGQS